MINEKFKNMATEDGTYKLRQIPKVIWNLEQVDQFTVALIAAKGLIPVLATENLGKSNLITTDEHEIGGIDDLRERKLFVNSILLAFTQADFQGKRIIALLQKEGLNQDEQAIVQNLCKKNGSSYTRVGKWPFLCVIESLVKLAIIDNVEYQSLDELRSVRNDLMHQSVAKYSIDPYITDILLRKVIQILLRLRELPVGLTAEIDVFEQKQFWIDIGFGAAIPKTEQKPLKDKNGSPFFEFQIPNPKTQYLKSPTFKFDKNGQPIVLNFVSTEVINNFPIKWAELSDRLKDLFHNKSLEEFLTFFNEMTSNRYPPISSKEQILKKIIELYFPGLQTPENADNALRLFDELLVTNGRWGLGCPGRCGEFWDFKPTADLSGFEPVDPNVSQKLRWLVNDDRSIYLQCDNCHTKIKLQPFKG